MIPSLKFLGKFFLFVFLVCYVYIGIEASLMLVKAGINKRQDISFLTTLIPRAVQRNAPEDVTEWVRLRPLTETAALIKILTPASGDLDSGIFFEITRRQLLQGQTEDALFWSQLGRYRMRYDVLRCGGDSAAQSLNDMLNAFAAPDLTSLLEKHPELVKKSIRQVLDFDRKYPARNNPSVLCKVVKALEKDSAAPVPRELWENVRQSLRKVTEFALKEMDEKKSR